MPTGIYKRKSKWDEILTKKYLLKEYSEKRKFASVIAKEVGCNINTVLRNLRKYNIEIRKSSDILTLEFLNNQYKNKSINQIAKETGTAKRTVSKYLKLYKIEKRTHSEATKGYGKKEIRVIDKIYYCLDCDKIIHWSSALYGLGMCNSCSHKGKKAFAYIDGRSTKLYYCIDCNKEICWQTALYGGHRCLSCAVKEDRKDPTKHYNWQGGISFAPYPLGWTKTFKEQIRYRDGYTCQLCGCPETECNRKLHVHHIDYDKENLVSNNLISLCNSCHMRTNFNRDYWENYFNKGEKQWKEE